MINDRSKRGILKISVIVSKVFATLLLLYSLSTVYNFIALNSSVDFDSLGWIEKFTFILTPVFSVIVYLLLSIIFWGYTYVVEVVVEHIKN